MTVPNVSELHGCSSLWSVVHGLFVMDGCGMIFCVGVGRFVNIE